SETSTVNKASPTITTVASSATIGGSIHDTATLSGATAGAGGSITFTAFEIGRASCREGVTWTVGGSGCGRYTSAGGPPASDVPFHADDGIRDVDVTGVETCARPVASETSTVNKASPTITTVASSATIGGSIHDTATLSGATAGAGGSITFTAF